MEINALTLGVADMAQSIVCYGRARGLPVVSDSHELGLARRLADRG